MSCNCQLESHPLTNTQKPCAFSLDVLIQVASPKFPSTGNPSKRRWKPPWPTAWQERGHQWTTWAEHRWKAASGAPASPSHQSWVGGRSSESRRLVGTAKGSNQIWKARLPHLQCFHLRPHVPGYNAKSYPGYSGNSRSQDWMNQGDCYISNTQHLRFRFTFHSSSLSALSLFFLF